MQLTYSFRIGCLYEKRLLRRDSQSLGGKISLDKFKKK
jgi:hypothetical protein